MSINEKSSTSDADKKECSYEPPRFTDEQRLEKIKTVLPIIEEHFRNHFEENHFPGLTYGFVVDGELLDSHSFGHTNLDEKIPVTTKSLFRMASMTKSFTAMAIIKLRDDGQLRLDDPVDRYIVELQATNLLTTDAPIITIRHLLTQDTGMPEDDSWADRQLALPDVNFLAMLKKGISLSNPPGSVWEYTNLGYAMLGRIITVVSQMPYQEYIKREILIPLGMTNTIWEYSEAPSHLLARGYRWESEHYSEEDLLHDGAYGAMGGLISSVEDFSKYVSYHLQAWPPRNEPEFGPLRRSSLREMHHPWNFINLSTDTDSSNTVTTSSYCYGLAWSKSTDGMVYIKHSGGLPGFGSNWLIAPDYGLGLVSFANRTYADLHPVNRAITNRIIKQVDLKPRQLPISKLLAERKEQLIEILMEKKWDITDPRLSASFAENFFLDQSIELRKSTSEELFNEAGKILEIEELIPENQLRGYFHIKGEQSTIRVAFSLSPENPPLIQELKLSKILPPS